MKTRKELNKMYKDGLLTEDELKEEIEKIESPGKEADMFPCDFEFDEVPKDVLKREAEELIAERRCLIKQAEDRKTRAITNGEKQYLEREIRKHNKVIKDYKEEIKKLK